ncbi:MAG: riboflavin biosynthesis protein RibF [Fimbriimonadaceae bacterium]|nr:MAG: riboflavin biosynthesis protein RibF [Fimbriimonadaceae bacterium]
MIVHFGLSGLRPEWRSSVACIGVFDGVHLGHRAVVGRALSEATRREAPTVLCTFDRHPTTVLAPDRVPPSLATLDQNLAEFSRLGVSVTVVLPFDRATAATPAQDFFDTVFRDALRAEAVVVGHDFAFGKGREGDTSWLSARIETVVVPPFTLEGRRVSSTEVRAKVASGEVGEAARLLGRPFSLAGVVVGGEKLGRELGYPTLNIARADDQVVPADGVYAGRCRTVRGTFGAAVSIGERPTVGGTARAVEAHLLDYDGEPLYGTAAEVGFLARIRAQERFDGVAELQRQIKADVHAVRGHLERATGLEPATFSLGS